MSAVCVPHLIAFHLLVVTFQAACSASGHCPCLDLVCWAVNPIAVRVCPWLRPQPSVLVGDEPSIMACRQAAKLLHVEVQQPGQVSTAAKPVPRAHSSVAALLSWQHAQLLAALPKR